MTGAKGVLPATVAALLVLTAALAVPLTGASGTTTLPEPGTPGEQSSAEDDEDAVFDLEFDIRLKENTPGATDTQHTITAQGLTENITVHYVGIRSEPFDYSNCSPDKTTALGIDRGNDDDGTETDKSVLSSYQQFTYKADSIVLTFYKEETLAGEPVEGYVQDELVAQQGNCIDVPSEPGWYQFEGFINGSSNGDTNTDYLIEAFSNYVYVCECADEGEAREKLGPPPNEQTGSTPTATATATPERTASATATATAAPTATATTAPERTATVTPAPTATATRTATPASTATTTAAPDRTASATTAPEQTARTTATNVTTGTTGTAEQSTGGPAQDERTLPRTPTVGAGPGFGVAATLLAVLSLFVLVRRRE